MRCLSAPRDCRASIFASLPACIATNTVNSLQAGLYYGYLGLIDGILERLIAELGGDVKVVATGGLAPLMGGGSKYIREVDDLLTLEGLRIIYERNLPNMRRRETQCGHWCGRSSGRVRSQFTSRAEACSASQYRLARRRRP